MDIRTHGPWWVGIVVGCTPAKPEPPAAGPTVAKAAVDAPLSSCAALPGGRDAAEGACGTKGLRGCEQTPTHPALRGRDLVLTRCFTADWKDTGERTLTRHDALVMMGADPDPDKVVCFFYSLQEWASLPTAAIDAAFEWAGCTERTMRDPFVDG